MRVATIAAVVGVAAVAAAGLYVWRKGGVAPAAQAVGGSLVGSIGGAVGGAAVDAAGGLASGVVGGIGSGVGLPTPSQTTEDPRVARWIIDNHGYFEASKWSGVPALLRAMTLPAGSGYPPPAGTAANALVPAELEAARIAFYKGGGADPGAFYDVVDAPRDDGFTGSW